MPGCSHFNTQRYTIYLQYDWCRTHGFCFAVIIGVHKRSSQSDLVLSTILQQSLQVNCCRIPTTLTTSRNRLSGHLQPLAALQAFNYQRTITAHVLLGRCSSYHMDSVKAQRNLKASTILNQVLSSRTARRSQACCVAIG